MMKEDRIPKYSKEEFLPKQNEYCVCVFVINEGEKLRAQLEKMKPVCRNVCDMVVADGGSSDGSTGKEILLSAGVNTLLVKQDAGKLGTQMRMAFDWALKRGYRGVVVVDGNGKDGMDAIPRFVEELEKGMDHIQGSRFIPGGYQENTPKSRLLGLKLLHVPVMRLASGFPYTDTTNGFRAYSAKLLSSAKLKIFRDCFNGYELHYYLAVEAPRLGFRCSEIPVSRIYPKTGKIPTKISPLKGNLNVIGKLFAAAFHLYNPGPARFLWMKYPLYLILLIAAGWMMNTNFLTNEYGRAENYERWQKDSENIVLREVLQKLPKERQWNSIMPMGSYVQAVGFQGMLDSWVCHFSGKENASLEEKTALIYRMNCFLLAVVLTLFLWFCIAEFGVLPAFCFWGVTMISPLLITAARNMYWVPWTFFLPFVLPMIVLKLQEKTETGKIPVLFGTTCLLTVFLRLSCSFEFTPCFMAMTELSVLYFSVKNGWSAGKFLKYAFTAAAAAMLAFLLSYGWNILQVYLAMDSDWMKTWNFLMTTVRKRTGLSASETGIPESMQDSFLPSIETVFGAYFRRELFPSVATGAFAAFFLVFFAASALFSVLGKGIDRRRILSAALLGSAAFLVLPVWIVLGKGHSFIHSAINCVLWFVPAVPLAACLACFIVVFCAARIGEDIRNFLTAPGRRMRFFLLTLILLAFAAGGVLWYSAECSGYRIYQNIFRKKGICVNEEREVYLLQTRRFYLIVIPANGDASTKFFFHLYPFDPAAFGDAAKNGKKNMDFLFTEKEIFRPRGAEYRMAILPKERIPVKLFEIGQFNSAGRIWTKRCLMPEAAPEPFRLSPVTDQNWENGISTSNPRLILTRLTNPVWLKGKTLSLPKGEKRMIVEQANQGNYVHLTLDKPFPKQYATEELRPE